MSSLLDAEVTLYFVLADRRVDVCKKLFTEMQHADHKLHHLLPDLKANVLGLRSNAKNPNKPLLLLYLYIANVHMQNIVCVSFYLLWIRVLAILQRAVDT